MLKAPLSRTLVEASCSSDESGEDVRILFPSGSLIPSRASYCFTSPWLKGYRCQISLHSWGYKV